MSFTIIDSSREELKVSKGTQGEDLSNSLLERWMNSTIFKLKEILPRTYEKLVEYKEREEILEVYERELRDVFLNVAGESLGEFFALRRYTGYKGRRIPCECGKEEMEFESYRKKEYISLISNIPIKRAYYRSKGCKSSQFPLDKVLDVERTHFSPGIRKISDGLGGTLVFKEVEDIMRDDMNIPISEREMERDTEEVGKAFEKAIKEEVESCMNGEIPEVVEDKEGEIIYIQADGTTVNTDSGWREVKNGAVFWAEKRKDKERSEDEAKRGKTTYVGTFENCDKFGERLYHEALKRGYNDGDEVVFMGDGAEWVWNQKMMHFPNALEILDFYHATEHVWDIGRFILGEGTESCKEWVERQLQILKDEDNGIDSFINTCEEISFKKPKLRKDILKMMGYFKNNRERMRYKEFRDKGYFIGSGVVESACKKITTLRLKRPGMRWKLENAQAVLQVRIAKINGRFDEYWDRRLRQAA